MATHDIMAKEKKPKVLRQITSAELREHNTSKDLWISIHGKIYDATAWIKSHPGGELPILNLAGQDVTDAFIAFHPAGASSILDSLPVVGKLSDHSVSEVSKDYRNLVGLFTKLGLFARTGGPSVAVNLLFMAAMVAMSVFATMMCSSLFSHVVGAALMGLVWMQSGFLGHDSGHYRISGNAAVDRAMQVVAGNCLTGISIAWWKRNHNVHHVACNSLDHDPDVQHMPIFAVSKRLFDNLFSTFYERTMVFDWAARMLIRIQHWTFYPVMCVARANLLVQSWVLLLSKKRVPGRASEIVGIMVFWCWFPLLISCLPSWGERAMFVLVSFAVTGIQHVQFCLNHFSSEVYLGPPKGNDWFQKQTMGTLDISCSPWMDWFHGGLQFQIEHHLFPRLPRGQLRRIAPFVSELCKKHGLPYSSFSFWEANVRTLRTLRAAAMEARDSTKPRPKNLVWEAVDTHG